MSCKATRIICVFNSHSHVLPIKINLCLAQLQSTHDIGHQSIPPTFEKMSSRPPSPTPEEPRTPIVVNEILAHVGITLRALRALVKDSETGKITVEMMDNGLHTLMRTTRSLLAKAEEYQTRYEQLEEEERIREAAKHPLVSTAPPCPDLSLIQIIGRDTSRNPKRRPTSICPCNCPTPPPVAGPRGRVRRSAESHPGPHHRRQYHEPGYRQSHGPGVRESP
jgi:hypothetical protein